ncbi:hypothetical protein PG913_07875 [Tenacibaculum pacificus]|uniref:hypothetical protein n=1 Tax=Tenacibaculum pacificus TaxID=3018314 RepID=UPI0022F3F048|nr:hypothetical protein [Tenacibaculum pacificus]WBX72823.1 hypothetical protein PG913_07875 [Tenacibaculum pacificus]
MKKKHISFFIFYLLSLSIISQSNNSILDSSGFRSLSQENIHLHLNTNFLLTGENLLYKVYNLSLEDKNISTLSKIAYVRIIDKNNTPLFNQKVRLNKGVGYGDLFLPNNIETGSYKIIAYTQWMRNKQIFFEENLYIINPFSNLEKIKTATVSNNIIKKNNDTSISYINTNKKNYTTRELVTLNITKKIKGTFSLSVRKTDNLDLPEKSSIVNSFKLPKKEYKNSTKFYIPELRGELISGKIISKDNNKHNLNNLKIGLSLPNKNKITKISVTDKIGNFYFNIKEPYKKSKATIQILNDDRHLYNFKIDKKNILETHFENFKPISITNKNIEIIKRRSLNLQIENAYNTIKKDIFIKEKINPLIFEDKCEIIILDDYKRFKTIKEVTIEILNNVWIDSDNNFRVKNMNSDTNKKLPTLLIVDGSIIYKHNDFLDYNANKIKSVSILRQKYVLGAQLYEGIIYMKTFKNDYDPNSDYLKKLNISHPQKQKKYFFQTHESIKKTRRIPDYRTQLFWQPNLDLTKKQISFFTSDVIGVFEIEIEGFTNSGKPISYTKNFTVK